MMAPFRRPDVKHEPSLPKEVGKYSPEKGLVPREGRSGQNTQQNFSTDDKQVKRRGCREQMDTILEKYTKLQLLSSSLLTV